MESLQKLSKKVYAENKYSQLTIDLVDEVEELCDKDYKSEKSIKRAEEKIGALVYRIENIIEVVDPNKIFDKYAMKLMVEILQKRKKLITELAEV